MTKTSASSSRPRQPGALLAIAVALGWWLLSAVTWPLWTPQSAFPAVPAFASLRHAPAWVDWSLLALAHAGSLTFGLLATQSWLTAPRVSTTSAEALAGEAPGPARFWLRLSAGLFFLSLAGLVALDQHRFQPWVWQLAILAGWLVLDDLSQLPERAWLLTCGIYAYSAWSKLDGQFAATMGPQMIDGLFSALHLPLKTALWMPESRAAAGWALPIGELVTAIAIAWRPSRTIGVILATVQHLLLMALLGPGGLDHQPGVIVWNLWFLVYNWLWWTTLRPGLSDVAVPRARPAQSAPAVVSRTGRLVTRRPWAQLGDVWMLFVLAWPLAHDWGYCDSWPAWAVFSARTPKCSVDVAVTDIPQLPPELVPWIVPGEPGDEWRTVRIDRWSLATLKAPIYPEDRFHIGVALDLVKRYGVEQIRVTRRQQRDPQGAVQRQMWYGPEGLAVAARQTWLNAEPRQIPVAAR